MSVYPLQRRAHALLADGTTVRIRPALAEDLPALLRLYRELSPENLRRRFFSVSPRSAEQAAARSCCCGEAPGELTLLALAEQRVVGAAEAHWTPVGADSHGDPGRQGAGRQGGPSGDHGPGVSSRDRVPRSTAEIALTVADDWHQRGIGTLMLEHLVHAARQEGVQAFTADALAENRPMLKLVADLGLRTARRFDGAEVRCTIELDPDEDYLTAVDSRARAADVASLQPLLRPRSVAVVGDGRPAGSLLRAVLTRIREQGFTGRLHAVSPCGDTIAEVPCRPTVALLPDVPDLAVLTVPGHAVPDLAEQCGKHGVRALVVMGPGGLTDPEAAGLLDACRRHSMRLVGPGCLGVAGTDPAIRLDVTLAGASPRPGTAGVAVRSGGIGAALVGELDRLGIGVSTFVSLGDEYDVGARDLLQWWECDNRTDLALLQLESPADPHAFFRTARRVARRMPVLSVDTARSEAAGPDTDGNAPVAAPTAIRRALFAQAGVIATRGIAELTATAALLHSQPLPAGSRVAVVGNSRGAALEAAAACGEAGLTLPELPAALVRDLAAGLPERASLGNPVTVTALAAHALQVALQTLTRHGAVDAVLAVLAPSAITTGGAEDPARWLASAPGRWPRTVAAVVLDQDRSVRIERGPDGAAIPCYSHPETAARALAHAAEHSRRQALPPGTEPPLNDVDQGAASRSVADFLEQNPKGGWAAPRLCSALLDAYGIPQPPWEWVTDEAAAADAARRLGGRVAVKGYWPGLVHKSEVGALRLDLDGPAAARAAYRDLATRFGDLLTGAVVQPMAGRGIELVAAAIRDELYGPLVLFGLGGDVSELLSDHAVRPAPLTDRDIHELITAPRSAPLLLGHRTGRPVDLRGLEQLLLRLSRMACDLPQLAEARLDPVLARTEGISPLDVRIRLLPRTVHDPYLRRLRERRP